MVHASMYDPETGWSHDSSSVSVDLEKEDFLSLETFNKLSKGADIVRATIVGSVNYRFSEVEIEDVFFGENNDSIYEDINAQAIDWMEQHFLDKVDSD